MRRGWPCEWWPWSNGDIKVGRNQFANYVCQFQVQTVLRTFLKLLDITNSFAFVWARSSLIWPTSSSPSWICVIQPSWILQIRLQQNVFTHDIFSAFIKMPNSQLNIVRLDVNCAVACNNLIYSTAIPTCCTETQVNSKQPS